MLACSVQVSVGVLEKHGKEGSATQHRALESSMEESKQDRIQTSDRILRGSKESGALC